MEHFILQLNSIIIDHQSSDNKQKMHRLTLISLIKCNLRKENTVNALHTDMSDAVSCELWNINTRRANGLCHQNVHI